MSSRPRLSSPIAERVEHRKETGPLLDAFFAWAGATVVRLSAKSTLAEAFRYTIKRRKALSRFVTDGRLEADNNIAENAMRGIALGRNNYLFCGSDTGGDRAASIYTLVQTAKLNGVNPEASQGYPDKDRRRASHQSDRCADIALLVLLFADLDSVVHSYSRTAHLERAASWAALVGVVFAIVMLGDPRLRRGGGSAEQVAAYDRALRSGQLPPDIEPDVWRGWLRRGLRSEGNLRVLRICFLTAVGVSAILTHPTVYRWVIASLYELLAMRFIITWPAVRARYARLAAEVEQRATRQTWG